LIEAVIFDLDGTLIQLPVDYERMFMGFRKIMKTEKVRPLLETVSKLDPNTKEQVFKAWDKAELAVSEKVTAKKEGISVYQKYSQKPKALVTMQGRALVKTILDRCVLRFDFIVTREDSLSRIEQLRNAAEKLKTPCQNVLFVGNTDCDVAAAEKVGCQFLRV